jgi:hypothetical protein
MGGTPQPPPTPPPTQATISVTSYGLADQELDPAAYGKTLSRGLQDSGLWEHYWLAFAALIPHLVEFVISHWFDLYDRLIALIADVLSKGVGRNIPGFWILIGSLISDLLGVNVDGAKIYADLQAHGTLPAMRDVGGGLIDLLVGEFTGTATGTGGQVSFSSAVNPATGLPAATLSPKSGVDATKALMGFVLASAVRQANIDGVVDSIPFGLGHAFEKYSEAMRTNLGIGRLMRFALRPIFQDLVAKPLTWAVNLQYRPALLDPVDTLLQWNVGQLSDTQLDYELGRHGYTSDQQAVLKNRHLEKITVEQARILRIHGELDDGAYHAITDRRGWRREDLALWEKYEDVHPARRLALAVVEEAALQYLRGHIPQTQLEAAISAAASDRFGNRLLSEGEERALANFSVTAQKIVRRHLAVAQLMLGYIDGVLTLGEVETHLSELGFSDDDVRALVQEMLIKQKAAADKAARTHSKATAPPATPAPPAP